MNFTVNPERVTPLVLAFTSPVCTFGRMPNKPRAGQVQITMRVAVDLILRAEYLAEQMSKERPGIEYDRLDAIRTTLATHLPEAPPGWAPSRGPMAKTDAQKRGKEKR